MLFVTNYTNNKPLKKESYHLLSIVQNMDEFVEAFMKRFRKEKIVISDCLDSIVVQAFQRGVLRSSGLFAELMKMVPQTMEEAYEEAQRFINLEKKLKSAKKECATMPIATRGKEKRETSSEEPRMTSTKQIKGLLGKTLDEKIPKIGIRDSGRGRSCHLEDPQCE